MTAPAYPPRSLFAPLCVAVALTFGGCAGSDRALLQRGDVVKLKVLHNTLRCGPQYRQPALYWFDDASRLRERLIAIAGRERADAAGSDADVYRQAALLVTMGERTVTGFRLNVLPQRPARRDGALLRVPLAWQTPAGADDQTAAVTRPCLLLSLPRAGIERIEVYDQSGALRLQLRLDARAGS